MTTTTDTSHDDFMRLLECADPILRQEYYAKLGQIQQLAVALDTTQTELNRVSNTIAALTKDRGERDDLWMQRLVSARVNKAALRVNVREGRVLARRVRKIIEANAESTDPIIRSIMHSLTWMTDAF